MTHEGKTTPPLIAPCGMNCRLCRSFATACPGCRGDDTMKAKTRVNCRIKNCEQLRTGGITHCCSCSGFPCDALRRLDTRYRTKYGMSMIDNLTRIKESGIRQFVRDENERRRCPGCGELICIHKPLCGSCGQSWRSQDKERT